MVYSKLKHFHVIIFQFLMEFVLASSSKPRANLLTQAKLNFTQYVTDVDEN